MSRSTDLSLTLTQIRVVLLFFLGKLKSDRKLMTSELWRNQFLGCSDSTRCNVLCLLSLSFYNLSGWVSPSFKWRRGWCWIPIGSEDVPASQFDLVSTCFVSFLHSPSLSGEMSSSTFSPVKRNTPPLTMFTVLSLLLLTGAHSATARELKSRFYFILFHLVDLKWKGKCSMFLKDWFEIWFEVYCNVWFLRCSLRSLITFQRHNLKVHVSECHKIRIKVSLSNRKLK